MKQLEGNLGRCSKLACPRNLNLDHIGHLCSAWRIDLKAQLGQHQAQPEEAEVLLYRRQVQCPLQSLLQESQGPQYPEENPCLPFISGSSKRSASFV